MSRVGRAPIPLPPDVQVTIDGSAVVVRGPKGELSRVFHPEVTIEQQDAILTVTRSGDSGPQRALHGLSRALLANMVTGVSAGFQQVLEISGVGYRASKAGERLVVQVGFSHPVEVSPPSGIVFTVDGTTKVSVSGIDKELVGQVAAKIRDIRPPEPYKGKGIHYLNERIRRKAGKGGKAGGKKK
jgi:large subunit ribosomal protein L6